MVLYIVAVRDGRTGLPKVIRHGSLGEVSFAPVSQSTNHVPERMQISSPSHKWHWLSSINLTNAWWRELYYYYYIFECARAAYKTSTRDCSPWGTVHEKTNTQKVYWDTTKNCWPSHKSLLPHLSYIYNYSELILNILLHALNTI